MADNCNWIHQALVRLPAFKFPYNPVTLPKTGIYFFYEQGEICVNHTAGQRIVRIGTARAGNLRSRIAEHFLIDASKMEFSSTNAKPSDRSIFRKNIGRALLQKRGDDYLDVWNIDFIRKQNRLEFGHRRDVSKEKEIETEITALLRTRFSFRYIMLPEESENTSLERSIIATVARCSLCKASNSWLGTYSPKQKIREYGLWQEQHVRAREISEREKEILLGAIERSMNSLNLRDQE